METEEEPNGGDESSPHEDSSSQGGDTPPHGVTVPTSAVATTATNLTGTLTGTSGSQSPQQWNPLPTPVPGGWNPSSQTQSNYDYWNQGTSSSSLTRTPAPSYDCIDRLGQ
uniref:Uncharacterized protein n=1 Tax=Pristionchus pacificus TaxID=54126 RepID=A0A2A6BZC2_PRIPA|eukprot:PDM71265.1 hypothetical protein PRIPAC_37672 [Pristionchus pacificus]